MNLDTVLATATMFFGLLLIVGGAWLLFRSRRHGPRSSHGHIFVGTSCSYCGLPEDTLRMRQGPTQLTQLLTAQGLADHIGWQERERSTRVAAVLGLSGDSPRGPWAAVRYLDGTVDTFLVEDLR